MDDASDALLGAELEQVWFVGRDTVQLIFRSTRSTASPSLQCWVWPRVRSPNGDMESGDHGYRDALCDLMGSTVTRVSVEDGVTIEFGERLLIIDPRREEVAGPEIAMLHRLHEISETIVWRAGEGPFAHLA